MVALVNPSAGAGVALFVLSAAGAGLANLPARLHRLLRASSDGTKATAPQSAEASEASMAGQRTFEGCDRE